MRRSATSLPFIFHPFSLSGWRGDAVDPVPRVEGRARPLRGHHQHEQRRQRVPGRGKINHLLKICPVPRMQDVHVHPVIIYDRMICHDGSTYSSISIPPSSAS